MARLRRLLARIAAPFNHRAAEDDLAREMDDHLALLEEEHRRRGMDPGAARLAARRALGSVAHAKDLHRDARSFRWMDDLRRDLRQAARSLRRTPGFTLVAVLALGLGIGVNTAFFTIVNAICLRGLPIDAPDRVLWVSWRDAQNRSGSLSYAEFDELRARATPFASIAAYTNTVTVVGDAGQPPARVSGALLSAGAFELLGDRPVLGRTFRSDEDRPGGPPVVIMGAEIWSSRYASDPGIIGQSVTVNGVPSTVIGVMPRGFMFPANADLWRPMGALTAPLRESRSERRLGVFARLADGVTVERARAEMAAIGASWTRDHPAAAATGRLDAVPINEQVNPSVTQRAWIAFITAGALVLLVACANVANLLLMRGAARGREIAIRSSIGATRARVVRQMLTEGCVLAALGGAAGIFLAWAGLAVLSGILPPETLPYWMSFTIDARVLSVTVAVCVGCVVVCGLPSALHASRVDPRRVLTDGGATTGGRRAHRWVAGLLAAEFAVTLILISLAVDSVRSGIHGRRTEFQIDPASMLTMWVTLPPDRYRPPESRSGFFDRLTETVADSPAIRSIALASALPYGGGAQQPVTVTGLSPDEAAPPVSVVSVDERYFSVLGVPLVRGRAFTALDGSEGHAAAIVNQRFVRLFLGDRDPLTARIQVGRADEPPVPIVGVATTVRQQAGGSGPDPVVFLPFRASPPATTVMIVRSAGEPAAPVSLLRTEIARLDPNVPIYRVTSFEQALRDARWNGRMSDTIVRSIAVVALLLALVGLYAVTGYTVLRWTRELAVRVALGARAGQVGWIVVRRVLMQLGAGLGAGIPAALAFDRAFNVQASPETDPVGMMDPWAIGLVMFGIAAVALLACLAPIRRAARVDPLVALRE